MRTTVGLCIFNSRTHTDKAPEDSKIDEAFDSSEDDSYSASRRWPIARSAKKRVRYEEDDTPPLEDDQEQEGEAACCALDTPQDPTAILGHSINGGVSITRPPSIQHEEPLTAPPPAVHAVHDRKEQEEFKPPPGSIVVNLCDSDTEITVTASARWPKEETMDVVKKEDEKAVLGAEEEEVAILKVQDKGASKDVVPPLKPSSKREQELKLKLRGLRLQKEEVDIELELLMMQQ